MDQTNAARKTALIAVTVLVQQAKAGRGSIGEVRWAAARVVLALVSTLRIAEPAAVVRALHAQPPKQA